VPLAAVSTAPSFPMGKLPSSAGQLSFDKHRSRLTEDVRTTSYRFCVGLSIKERLKSPGAACRSGPRQAVVTVHSRAMARGPLLLPDRLRAKSVQLRRSTCPLNGVLEVPNHAICQTEIQHTSGFRMHVSIYSKSPNRPSIIRGDVRRHSIESNAQTRPVRTFVPGSHSGNTHQK